MRRSLRSLVVATVALTGLAAPASSQAAVFEPTRTDDPAPGGCRADDCSLREAVIPANARAGADRVALGSEEVRR